MASTRRLLVCEDGREKKSGEKENTKTQRKKFAKDRKDRRVLLVEGLLRRLLILQTAIGRIKEGGKE